MAFVVKDRVKETASTTGTGAFTLSGAPTNYVTFNSAIGVGNVTWYCINNLNANEWEVGLGTLTASTTLTRTTVIAGTNGTSAVNFSAGTKEVFVTGPASKVLVQDDSGNVTLNGALSSTQTLCRTNMVINPHGSIQQETTTPVTTSTSYLADQWQLQFTAATAAIQAGVTTGAFSNYDPSYMFVKTTTAKAVLAAGDFCIIQQPLEGLVARRLLYGGSLAKASWLRFRASCSQSATCSFAIRNGAANRSYVQTFAVTTTPTDYTFLIPGDTTGTWAVDNTISAALSFCTGAGTTFQTSTLGAWQAGNFPAANTQTNLLGTLNAQLSITDVQWSQSNVLLPFEPIDYALELERSQRYYMKSTDIITTQTYGASIALSERIEFPVTMRVGPAMTVSPTGFSGVGFNAQSSIPSNPYGFIYEFTTPNGANNTGVGTLAWTANARM